HYQPARHMGEADGRAHLVDVLSAWSSRAIRLELNVLRVDLDVVRGLHVGHDLDESERRMAAMTGVEWRETYQAVHAALRLEVAICVWPLDIDGYALD